MNENPNQPLIIIASNRGPVTFLKNEFEEQIMERGKGGLVTALTGLTNHSTINWISCAMSPDDALWMEGELHEFQHGDNKMYVQFVTPDQDAYEAYYNEISNPLLWFLQHSMWDIPRAPIINHQTWQAWDTGYVAINQLFAEKIAQTVNQSDQKTLIMLQDYHLYLTARNLRNNMLNPQAKIMHFIHIPWPGPEYWGILPPRMRQSILNSLCAVDMLGFQTKQDALNFIRTCQSYLPSARVNFRRNTVRYRKRITHVRDFPISIDVQSLRELAASPEAIAYGDEICEIVGDKKLILRVDRIEPSKNIIRGFQAFEEMLEMYPEYINQVVFLSMLVPSRLDVSEYQDYLDELMAIAGRINANYGNSEWEPVRLLVGENYPRAIAAMKEYDILLVNAIADGMNLVAKEGPVVNQQDGVLLLSEQAGASQQLGKGAIVIPPCDVYATAKAMHRGLTMRKAERTKRAQFLRNNVETEDIHTWLDNQLKEMRCLEQEANLHG